MVNNPTNGNGSLPSPSKNIFGALTMWSALLTPIISGGFGFYQWKINEELEIRIADSENKRKDDAHINNMTDHMVAAIRTSVANLNLTNKDQMRIELAMLKMKLDSLKNNGDKDIQIQFDVRRAVPFYFALMTDQHEMLADIGGEARDIEFWLPMAYRSGDQKIKMTAVRALWLIIITSRDKNSRISAINGLIELDQTTEIREIKIEANRIYGSIVLRLNFSELSSDDDLKKALNRLTERASILKTEVNALAEGGVSGEDYRGNATNGGSNRNNILFQERRNEALVQQALNKAANTLKPIASTDIMKTAEQYIKDYESKVSSQRDEARAALGRMGAPVSSLLFEILDNKNATYRQTLGAVVSLARMDPDIDFSNRSAQDLSNISSLLTHKDNAIRGNIINFLESRNNIQTIKWLEPIIWEALDKQPSDYWASRIIRIVQEWYDIDSPQYPHVDFSREIAKKLTEKKSTVVKSQNWIQTSGNIDGALDSINKVINRGGSL